MKRRRRAQIAFFFAFNPNLVGFLRGSIFTGITKGVCIPVLNCYSCPAAIFACPVGAMQTVAGSAAQLSRSVLGVLLFVGALVGRAPCGWACPFGLMQDLLAGLQKHKLRLRRSWEKLRYAVLAFTVVGAFYMVDSQTGVSIAPFCRYICPQGTLQAGIPLMAANGSLRHLIGGLFWWKVGLLTAVLLAAVFIKRPFCRFICPLGALLGPTNWISRRQVYVDCSACVDCSNCREVCPMDIDIRRNPRDFQCIRCGDCSEACPEAAISQGIPPDGDG